MIEKRSLILFPITEKMLKINCIPHTLVYPVYSSILHYTPVYSSILQYSPVYSSILQYTPVYSSIPHSLILLHFFVFLTFYLFFISSSFFHLFLSCPSFHFFLSSHLCFSSFLLFSPPFFCSKCPTPTNTFRSVPNRIRFSQYSQVSVLQDTTQSGTTGCSIII